MAGEKLVQSTETRPTATPKPSGLPPDWSEFRNRLAQTAFTLPDGLRTKTLRGAHSLHHVLNEIPWLVAEDVQWLNLKAAEISQRAGEVKDNLVRSVGETVVFAREHPRLVLAQVVILFNGAACTAGVGEPKNPKEYSQFYVPAIAGEVVKGVVKHDPRIPPVVKTAVARVVDETVGINRPNPADSSAAATPTKAEVKATPANVQEVYLATDGQGRVVQPTVDLLSRIPTLRKAALDQLTNSMIKNTGLFSLPPSSYGVIEHDMLSPDGNSLTSIGYLISDAGAKVTTKVIQEGVIEIQLPDNAKLFYWNSIRSDQPFRVNLPQGVKINRLVFDAVNNRLLAEYTDEKGSISTRIIPLSGSQAGEMIAQATSTVTPSPTVRPTPTETIVPKMPELKIDGPYIRNTETGNPINFEGISIFLSDGARRNTGKSINEYVKFNIEENEKLGIRMNMVRLSFYSKDITEKDISDFIKTADYLASRGIIMVITPHNDQRSKINDNYYLPNQIDKDTLVKLASVLKNNKNVIYGLWNEPANIDWNNWRNIINDMYQKIKQEFVGSSNTPIIMVPGINWSRDFRGADIPIPLGNYFIDVHNYPVVTNDQGNRDFAEPMWQNMIGVVPIIVSEVGDNDSRGGGGAQTDIDLQVIQRTYELMKTRLGQIGILIWRGELSSEGVRNSRGLTPRGKLLLQIQQDLPPSDLLKK